MTLCLLYFLHNQSVSLDHQRLINLERSKYSVENRDFHSRLKATLKQPSVLREANTKFIKNIITEAPVISDENKTVPGYLSIIGNKVKMNMFLKNIR